MKSRFLFTVLFTLFTVFFNVFAQQEKYIKHTVTKGETINTIAQKYRVTPFDIYSLNPDSQNGIKEDGVLLIPSSNYSVAGTQNNKQLVHIIQPKETLFSISKQYGVSIEDIKKANTDVVFEGIKIGQSIKIPTVVKINEDSNTSKPITTVEKNDKTLYHVIEPKESKYGISKKYGISIFELERLNPQIVSEFPIGFTLVVSGNKINQNSTQNSKSEKITHPISDTKSTTKINADEHIVLQKETIYSIANEYSVTEQELILLNPELKNGLKTGMKIRLVKTKRKESAKKEKINLLNTINATSTKQLAILLPFNLTDIDSLNSTPPKIIKTKLLNMTLDFYSGALMAVDSAKVLGLDVIIKILDSQETKTTSNVESSVVKNNLQNMDAVIGPFYQANVEKLAQLLSSSKTPVISPLSKEIGTIYPNLYQSTPTTDFLRNTIFDYIKSKRGKIIAVVDNNQTLKNYISEKEPSFSFAGLTSDGTFVADSLISKFDKNKINYVVLDSENKTIISATTAAMLTALNEYQVQLVILGQNENFNFSDASLKQLAKLKPLFPSLTKPNYSKESKYFVAKYKKTHKINPNKYAIRGFDVTFDTLLRLAQDKSFEQTIQDSETEQIENRFYYLQNEANGYSNNGIYIMYYDIDSILKSVL